VCEFLRKHEEKSRAEAEAQRLMFERADAARAEEEKKRLIAKEEQRKRDEQYRIEYQKEEAERKAHQAAWQKEQDDFERKARQKKAQQKKVCGDDYHKPRIGMTLERAKLCIGDIKMSGQLNRADGVVSAYEIPDILYMHFMDNVVVSWGRY
jgi:hypothetical protein